MTMLIRNGRPDTPSGLKVSPHSYATLEQVAQQLRGMLPRKPGEQFMLDCKTILEKTLPIAGFNLHVADIDELDECAAFTIPDQGLIVFREDIYSQLHNDQVFGRSTVIHETSHIVLRHAAKLHRGATMGNHKFYEDSEWQAKALTAAIMMPMAACKIVHSPHELAEICLTSEESATYRLKRLVKDGLIARPSGLWEEF